MIAAGIAALSIAPICFTSSAQPDPPKAQPLALVEQFDTAPAAVIACFGAGFVNAGVLALAPLYAAEHFGPQSAAEFYAAAMAGSLLLQWPAGLLSDRLDRRAVIMILNVLAMAAALALALLGGQLVEWGAVLLFFVWGAGALSFYSVATAHMADRVDHGKLAQSAAGLLFVWAAGSIIGPISLGIVVDALDVEGMFWFAAASALLIALAMLCGAACVTKRRKRTRKSSRLTPKAASRRAKSPRAKTSRNRSKVGFGKTRLRASRSGFSSGPWGRAHHHPWACCFASR